MDLFNLRAVIALDTSGYERGIKNSSSLFDKTAGSIKKTASAISKAVAAGVGAASTAVSALIKKSLDARGELEQNMGGSEQVFKEFANTVQTVGAEAYRKLGLSQSEYLATANKMGALLQGSGFAIEESMNMTTAAMQRAADVASIMGLDTSAAMEAVAGAAKGNFTMMDNLGVAINDTALAQYALSKGIKKSTKDMSTQEKVGLAMELFLERTAYAAGNYARENETLAGSLSTAKAAFDNFLSGAGSAEQLVESVMGAAKVVASSLVEILPDLAAGIGVLVAGLAPMLPGLFEQLLPAVLSSAVTLLNGIVSQLPSLVPIVIDALFDLLLGASENDLSLLSIGLSIITGIGKGLINSLPLLGERALELIGSFAASFEEGAQTLIGIGASILSYISGGLISNEAGSAAILEFFSGIIDSISAGISSASEVWNQVWPELQELAQSAISGLQTAWTSIGQPVFDLIKSVVSDVIGFVGSFFAENFDTMSTKASDVLTKISGWFSDAFASISKVWSSAGQPVFDAAISIGEALLKSWNTIWPSAQALAQAAFDTISVAWTSIGQPVFDLIKSVVSDVIGFVGSFFVENFDTMSSTASDVLTTISELVSTTFSAIATFWTETLQPVLVAIGGFLQDTLQPAWDTVFAGVKTIVSNTFDGIITLWDSGLKPILEGIGTFLTGVFTLDWQTAWSGIEGILTGVWSTIETIVSTTWTNITTTISTALETAKTTVSNAIQAILDFFDVEIKWPDIPMPHFSISPKGWKIGDLLQGTIPSLGISWYNRAMNNPMLLRGATIFGMQDGQFLGGGDAGGEVVAGANTVARLIYDAVRSAMSGSFGGVVVNQNIYSEAKTAADLMREARWEAERAVLTGVHS